MARPKHRTRPGATYFVTTDTWERRALFRNPALAEIVAEKIFEYRNKDICFLHSYVLMPDHLHLILTPGETTTAEKAVQLIKGGSAHEIGTRQNFKFPVWHPGFTEHQIQDQEDFETHVRYIDMNPLKAKLAERPGEYPYCSARGKHVRVPWPVASGAKAQPARKALTAGLKPRPSGDLW